MKRIVILIDGTWNKEGIAGNRNVAALDPGNRISGGSFIKTTAADGVAQHVHYNDGVGAEDDLFKNCSVAQPASDSGRSFASVTILWSLTIQWATRFTSSGSRAAPMQRAPLTD
jgi:uncharacterized protein (DUF2235 family)